MRKKVGLFLLVVTQILVLQAKSQQESEAPLPGMKPLEVETKRGGVQLSDQKADKSVDQSVGGSTTESSSQGEGESSAEAPDIRRLGKHHSTDKSVAGGGVILGGLVTATFAAVFCYIRVTRKRHGAGY